MLMLLRNIILVMFAGLTGGKSSSYGVGPVIMKMVLSSALSPIMP